MAPNAPPLPTVADLFPRRPAWMADGACRASEVNFFPERGESAALAKAVCAGCPTRGPCLAYALETDADGVWGGTSARERRALKRDSAA